VALTLIAAGPDETNDAVPAARAIATPRGARRRFFRWGFGLVKIVGTLLLLPVWRVYWL
jgi:hypothetical protein